MARQERDRWSCQAERIDRRRKRREEGARKGEEDARGQSHNHLATQTVIE